MSRAGLLSAACAIAVVFLLVGSAPRSHVGVMTTSAASAVSAAMTDATASINVQADFGATGDGATDDTFALQGAIDAAITANRPIYLPPGVYLTSGVTITQPVSLVGAGATRTILKARPGTNAVLTLGNGANIPNGMEGLEISDLGIDGAGVANYGIWMRQYGGIRARLDHLLVQNCTGNPGIGIANEDQAYSMLLSDLTVKNNVIGIRLVKRVQETKIIASQIYGNRQNQVVIGDGATLVTKVSIISSQVEPTSVGASGAALLVNGVNNLYLGSVYSEAKPGATGPAIEVAPGLPSFIVAEGFAAGGNQVADYAIRLPSDGTNVNMTLINPVMNGYLQNPPVQNLDGPTKKVVWIGTQNQPAMMSVQGGLVVGENGARLWGNFVATASYDPPSLAPGANAMTKVAVPGARRGDVAVAGFSLVQDGIFLSASVTANDTVTVLVENKSGRTIDLPSGTLKVAVWNYQ